LSEAGGKVTDQMAMRQKNYDKSSFEALVIDLGFVARILMKQWLTNRNAVILDPKN
jgi:hypothetical protein